MEVLSSIMYTKMPTKYDDMFWDMFREYCDKDRITKAYYYMDMIAKVESIYDDLQALGETNDLIYRDLFYQVMKRFSVKRPDINEINSRTIKETYFDKEFRTKVSKMGECKSGYISYMRSILPRLNKLLTLLEQEKSYAALKEYKELLDFLNLEAIEPSLSEKAKSDALEKRYSIPENTISAYQLRAKTIEFNPDIAREKTSYVQAYNYSSECKILQKYLYSIMLEYYKKTGYFYRQINADLAIYILNDITILTYKNDDLPGMTIKQNDKTYSWKTQDFWAIYSSPNFDLKHTKITDESFSNNIKPNFGWNILTCPEEYLDEAFLRYKTKSDNMGNMNLDFITRNELEKIGYPFDLEPTEKLFTTNGFYYFKNPLLVDELRIKHIENYEIITKLLARKPEERVKYLSFLRSRVKNVKSEKLNISSARIKIKEEARMPYKD